MLKKEVLSSRNTYENMDEMCDVSNLLKINTGRGKWLEK